MPGSLGIEAMCQLLQWYLIERGTAADLAGPRFEPVMTGHPLTWKYRGQVLPTDGRLTIELEITAPGEDERGRYAIADGWLWVDGLRIYQVSDLGHARRSRPALRPGPELGQLSAQRLGS